jgi:threonine/homoserine/homoserine lactone efflux protein
MSLEVWLAFSAASIVLLVIPGPTVLLVVSYALGSRLESGFPDGCRCRPWRLYRDDAFHAWRGCAAAASATVFTAVKWAGAAYLIWLGIKLFRAGGTLHASARHDKVHPARMLVHAWLVTALNPKSITFFVAFLPQFLSPHRDFLTQMLVFESTFLVLAFLNAFAYALLATRARRFFSSERALRIFNRAGGTLLIGAGVATASMRST